MSPGVAIPDMRRRGLAGADGKNRSMLAPNQSLSSSSLAFRNASGYARLNANCLDLEYSTPRFFQSNSGLNRSTRLRWLIRCRRVLFVNVNMKLARLLIASSTDCIRRSTM